VNAKSLNNTSPLQLALRSNRINIAELLVIKYGAEVNCSDKYGRTPLHCAAFNGELNIVNFLLENGADINILDHDGYTPIHKAVWRGKLDCVKRLLECNASVKIASNKGYTPLHIAVHTNDITAAIILLESGDDVNSRDNEGLSLVHKSVQNGNLCMVKTLVEFGAIVNFINDPHPTPIQLAIANGDIPTCIYLYENGAEIMGDTTITAALLRFVARKVPCMSPELVTLPPSTLNKDLHSLVNNEMYHDVVFMLEGKPLYAWRGILCCRSDYFRAMFEQQTNWKESSARTIEMKHVQYRTFLAVIVYIYTGDIMEPITVEDTLLLLSAANKFILPRLKTLCEKILVNELTVENVCTIFRHADLHMSSFLHKACVQFIAERIDAIPAEELDDIIKVDSFASCVVTFLRNDTNRIL